MTSSGIIGVQNNESPFPPPRRYAVLITSHARQRWIERIADPTRYAHLATCKVYQCPECNSKIQDIHRAIRCARRYIDGEIARRIREAKAADSYVRDVNFMAAVKKRYGEERDFTFLQDHSAVFVIVTPPEEPSPVLLTVMSLDMIDGTVFQNFSGDEMKAVFSRWKHERRQKR